MALLNNQSSKGIDAKLAGLPVKSEDRPYRGATSKPQRALQRLRLRWSCDSQLSICRTPNVFIPHRKRLDAAEESLSHGPRCPSLSSPCLPSLIPRRRWTALELFTSSLWRWFAGLCNSRVFTFSFSFSRFSVSQSPILTHYHGSVFWPKLL